MLQYIILATLTLGLGLFCLFLINRSKDGAAVSQESVVKDDLTGLGFETHTFCDDDRTSYADSELDMIPESQLAYDIEETGNDVSMVDHQCGDHEVDNILPSQIILKLMAFRNQPYIGYSLLQSLLNYHFHYGDDHLFSRYQFPDGTGSVYFSLANICEPGSFDLNNMGAMQCRGLVLFMKPREVQDLREAFDMMVETGIHLQEDLGGRLLNENNQVVDNIYVAGLRTNISRYYVNQQHADLLD